MNEKKKSAAPRQKPLHTIRCGDVTATLTVRQSNCGYAYVDFSLARSWNSLTTGKEVQGTSFFAENEADLISAIRDASAWIRSRNSQEEEDEPVSRPITPSLKEA
jgi:hypothetical protein